MQIIRHLVSNDDGWKLSLVQTFSPTKLVKGRRPVLIVPGYGMNSYIYSYHPNGLSLVGFLADAGFEVWRADLRGQGGSISTGGGEDFRLEDLALTDVRVALGAVLAETKTGADRVDVLGGSLGGALMFTHAVLEGKDRMATLVCVGSPVRWVKVHPALRLAAFSPRLVGQVRFRGTRLLARVALPLLARATPWALSIYMNPEITDVGAASEMAKTVENPNRFINREIAQWIHDRDLTVRGVNVSEAIKSLENPLLCVTAQADGIVPPETAAFPFHQIGSERKRLLEVGTKTISMAHADLFVSVEAHERVFTPVRDWFLEQYEAAAPEASEEFVE